jgi:PiT family inorganic phosphate transporter
MWWRAQQQKVDHSNVNADWDETTNSVVPADVREASSAKVTVKSSEVAQPKTPV